MQANRVSEAAQMLYEARRRHRQIESLPDRCAPRSITEAYAVQNELIRLLGGTVVGWKVGCISKQAQQNAGTTEPFSGPVLAQDLHHSGCEIPRGACFAPALQAEFAFRLAKDLPARHAPIAAEVIRDAIGTVLPALEIADSRFVDSAAAGAVNLVADGGKAGLLVVGDLETDVRDVELVDHSVALYVNGKQVALGHGRNVMGDPVRSLQWLANAMAGRGESLRAGQIISTGTCTGSHSLIAGDEVIADYGTLGTVKLRFA
jgi:2-keto-4-pentenoate hydratase